MLVVSRVLWIAGLLALVVVLALIVNPRAQAPQRSSQSAPLNSSAPSESPFIWRICSAERAIIR